MKTKKKKWTKECETRYWEMWHRDGPSEALGRLDYAIQCARRDRRALVDSIARLQAIMCELENQGHHRGKGE